MIPAAHNRKRFDRLLLVGLLSGPVVYTLYFLVVYSAAEVACKAGFAATEVFGLELVRVLVVVLTILATVLLVIGGLLSYRVWQRSKKSAERRQDAYSEFAAMIGVGLNAYFVVAALATGLPVLLHATCASM